MGAGTRGTPTASPSRVPDATRPTIPHVTGVSGRRSQFAAAANALYDIVSGPFRPSRILGVSRAAVYLEVEDPTGVTVVALLARDSVRLPNGMVLAEPQSVGPFADVEHSTSVRVGRCSVEFGGPTGPRTVHVGRWWRPRPPRPARDPAASAAAVATLAAHLAGVTGGLPHPRLGELDTALDDRRAAARACDRLIGRGPGLTPSGDDLVCGFLLAARHLGGAGNTAALAGAARQRAARATTRLSAALIAHAAHGEACPEVTALLDAVSGHAAVAPTLAALRRIGHTSGTDLAMGVLAGARAALATHPPPRSEAHERPHHTEHARSAP